jgi:hypothetical protein
VTGDAPTGEGPGEAGPTDDGRTDGAPSQRHVLRWVLLGLAVAVLAVVAVFGASYAFRDRPDPKSIDSAVGDFRKGTAPSSSAGTADRLPAAGVYELSGSGGEQISFPPNSQADGSTMPASVELLGGGCFRWRIDYNEAHWHQLDFCRDGGDLLLGMQKNYQRWDFGSVKVENTGDFDCVPKQRYPIGSAAGTVTTSTSCSGTNTAVAGRTTTADRTEVVGREQLRIGGTKVTAVHLRQHDDLAGAQTGANDVDWWFDLRTGLPVQAIRTYRLDTASPVGTITYNEAGRWQLESMEPRR